MHAGMYREWSMRVNDRLESVALRPGHSFLAPYNADAPIIDIPELSGFMQKCSFASALLSAFVSFLDPNQARHWNAEQRKTWHDVFQQEVIYPPQSRAHFRQVRATTVPLTHRP